MGEIENCSSESTPINQCQSQISMSNGMRSLEVPEAASSKRKGKGKRVPFKRRNPSVTVRRLRANNVNTIGLPLGMSFAAVLAQVNAPLGVGFLKFSCLILAFSIGFNYVSFSLEIDDDMCFV